MSARRRLARRPVLAALTLASVLAAAPVAHSSVSVSSFSLTPSTTQAGAHPSLRVSISFRPASSEVESIALHLPAGLTATGGAAPFCSRGNLLADLCPLRSKIGTVRLVGEALGFEAEAVRNIYNVRPAGAERLRLGIPLFGSVSRGGLALLVPVTARPDGGLDVAVAGPPREVAGYAIRLKDLELRLTGIVRSGSGRRRRARPLLTNPRACRPASTMLEVTARGAPPTRVTQLSSFTPTGC